jgi:hypothetical protein
MEEARMTSVRIGMAALGAALVCAATPPAAGAQAGQDSVRGSGTYGNPAVPFTIDATSGASGENARGAVTDPTFGISDGRVMCIDMRGGGRAVVGGVSQSSSFGAPLLFAYYVADGGTPGAGVDVLGGEFQPLGGRAFDPGWCRSRTGLFTSFATILSGDIAVVDAPALPTSKEQCKHGGYRNFGARFRNQGACLSFVARSRGRR